MSALGKGIPRVDGRLKVTGRATYTADVNLERQGHAVLVLSTIAVGRIVSIDTSAAQGMPGVLDVLTHLNAPRLPEGGRAAVNPPAGRVLSLLQDDLIHYNRQPIAVVTADTREIARSAAAAVIVHYEAQAGQLDVSQAMAQVHAPKNVNGEPADTERGRGLPAGARTSNATVSQDYHTPMQHHNPLEPHATLAQWDGDHLTLYDTTQYVSGVRETVAKTLGLRTEQVRVVCPFVGGGFGCKGSVWSHVVLAAIAAQRVHRPVKLVLDRGQMFGPVGGRPLTRQTIDASADAGGRLLSMRHAVLSHTSRIEDFTEGAALQTRILYDCPQLRTSHRLVTLDVATPTFQRAPGHATGSFALECALDELAYSLHIDPIELRLRNEPAREPESGLPWSSRALKQCYRSGATAFGWRSRSGADAPHRFAPAGSGAVGWGVATATYPANRQGASAQVWLDAEGGLTVRSGTQDLGTGTYTIMAQTAADALGYPLDRIRVELGDSELPHAPVSGGSQSAASVLPAVQAAALGLREKIVAIARADQRSAVFNAEPQDIVIEQGLMGTRTGRSRDPLILILRRAQQAGLGADAIADPGHSKKTHSLHSFGAVFVEVNIDRELGVIRVPRVVARYSIGRLLNAKTGRSQLIGGIVWGIGMALMEHSVLDGRDGRIVNADLAEYHVPTNADIGDIDVDVVEEHDAVISPLGARGIGEIGITGVAAALSNAVYHATGIRVRELPITLDKLIV